MARQQVLPGICPILVMATNTSTRNMLTGYLEAWGAHVSAAVDVIEAKTILGAGLPRDTTAILSLTLCKWRGLTPVPFAAPAAWRDLSPPLQD